MNIKLTRRQLLVGLFIVSLLIIGAGTQLKPPKVFRIGVLNPDMPLEEVFHGFQKEMTSLGYAEGQRVEYIYAGAVGNEPGKIEAAAAVLKAANVDLVLAIANPSVAAAKAAFEGTNIPVVFWVLSDPVAANYVQNLQTPGANMTGITIGIEGIASEGRRLEWLAEVSPNIKQVFIPYNPDHKEVMEQVMPTVQKTADALGLELTLYPVHNVEEVRASTEHIPSEVDAIYIIHLDRMVMREHALYIEKALERHLPLSTFISHDVEEGSFMSFGTQYFAIGEQAARMTDHLLKGAKAGEMPVEIPEFYLSINLKTAETIGLEIPDSIIRQADLVIR